MHTVTTRHHPIWSFFRKNGMLLLVAVGGVLFSLLTFHSVRLQITHHLHQEFEWVAQNRQKAVLKGLEIAMGAVYEMNDLYQSAQPVNPEVFYQFATLIRSRQMGVENLQWVPLARKGDRETAIITLMEPATSPLSRIGDDYLANPRLAQTLNEARDTGRLTISGRILIENTSPPRFGFLAIHPVYRPDAPISSILERHANLAGFIIGFFQFSNLAQHAIAMLEPRGVECMILDDSATEEERFLNFYASRLSPAHFRFNDPLEWQLWLGGSDSKSITKTRIGNRSWSVTCAQTDHFRTAEWFTFGHWITLLTGFALTGWLLYYLTRIRRDLEIRTGMANQLQESERLLSALFQQSPDIIRLVDRQGHSILVNRTPAGQEIDPTDRLTGPNNEFRNLYLHTLELAFTNHEINHFHYRSPENTWWEIRVVPLQEESRIVNAMVVATDITENKMLEEQASKNARLASLGLMAAGVAHEINNPNNSIYYNANLLQEAWPTVRSILEAFYRENGDFAIAGLPYEEMRDKLPQTIGWIIDNTNRIKKIVELLKHLARNEAGNVNQPVDLLQTIQGTLVLLNNTILKHTDRFRTLLPPRLPMVTGNAQQIEQVLINILFNALQALPDRDREVRLEATMDDSSREVILIIRDEGIGIPPAILEKVTEPFFTTRLEQGGTGLGLSISSSIIKNHGGRLRFESQPNIGTTVFVHIPYQESHP
ncbi:MAG: CHASE domain-containing protein [Magnetococcales bacterium]|nr:CHASE domain-containing protein [Magnetococcales bacterium]